MCNLKDLLTQKREVRFTKSKFSTEKFDKKNSNDDLELFYSNKTMK